MEGPYLLSTVVADQGDEGFWLRGHGTLVDDYLPDVELLQGGGRCGAARAQDDVVAHQFIITSSRQMTFVPGGRCRRHQVMHKGNISRFLLQEPGKGCTFPNDDGSISLPRTSWWSQKRALDGHCRKGTLSWTQQGRAQGGGHKCHTQII